LIFLIAVIAGMIESAFGADEDNKECFIVHESAMRVGYSLVHVFDRYLDFAEFLTPVWVHVCGQRLRIGYDTPVGCRGENLPPEDSKSDFFMIELSKRDNPSFMSVHIGSSVFSFDPAANDEVNRISLDAESRKCIEQMVYRKGRARWRKLPENIDNSPSRNRSESICVTSDYRAKIVGRALSVYLWRHVQHPEKIPVRQLNFCNVAIIVDYDTSNYSGLFGLTTLIIDNGSRDVVRLIVREAGYSADDIPGRMSFRKKQQADIGER
jgi:hypothetical protein